MGKTEAVSRIIDSLAWPAAITIMVLVFRKQVREILRSLRDAIRRVKEVEASIVKVKLYEELEGMTVEEIDP